MTCLCQKLLPILCRLPPFLFSSPLPLSKRTTRHSLYLHLLIVFPSVTDPTAPALSCLPPTLYIHRRGSRGGRAGLGPPPRKKKKKKREERKRRERERGEKGKERRGRRKEKGEEGDRGGGQKGLASQAPSPPPLFLKKYIKEKKNRMRARKKE